MAPATLPHLLCECPAVQSTRVALDVPKDPLFLWVFLLSLDSSGIFHLVSLLLDALAQQGTMRRAPQALMPPRSLPVDPLWVVRWDGSFLAG